eukprot:TRINITY_DN13375_c0_g1_i1.p1 TRINITY_DN13375_c0_g1~~TRINITY_DN13375_c0_g1_i1.p1  ORF type:complete len:436 (+),score=49.61 TRINITY_DN13375_c0_g1_i1:28-1335(+)
MSSILFGIEDQSNEVEKESDTLALEGFEKIRKIGSGSHGDAYLVYDIRTKVKYVAKEINLGTLSAKDQRYAMSEVRCMSLLNHPCIISYHSDVKKEGQLVIIMEYADGGDLECSINKRKGDPRRDIPPTYFKEHEILFMFSQICLSLHNIHSARMLHRDLKTANIFLTTAGIIKLGDFGYSHVYQETVSNLIGETFCGTPCCIAPELWQNLKYSKQAEVWSLGIVLYELMSLKKPYTSPSMNDLMLKVMQGEVPPPPSHFSEELKALLYRLLQKDPQRRPSLSEIFQIQIIRDHLGKLRKIVGEGKTQAPVSPETAAALISHIDSILVEQPAAIEAAPGKAPEDLFRSDMDGCDIVWTPCKVTLQSGSRQLHVTTMSETETFNLEDAVNACPVPYSEAQAEHSFGIFFESSAPILLRALNKEDMNTWLDIIHGAI